MHDLGCRWHFTQSRNLDMPFQIEREPDSESDSDMDVSMPTKKEGPPARRRVAFTRIPSAVFQENEETIKSGLRSNSVSIHTRFPAKGVIEATRFPSSSDFKVYVLPISTPESVDVEFPPSEFPAGFVDFFDATGKRWKCVAMWNGKEIQYVASVAAEVRLCGHLFAGSTKGGKVRWDRGVAPHNRIPGKYCQFAVSDKVLLDRRKAQYPEQLKQHQQACGLEFTALVEDKKDAPKEDVLPTPVETVMPVKTKKKKRTAAEDDEVPKETKKPKKKNPGVSRQLFDIDLMDEGSDIESKPVAVVPVTAPKPTFYTIKVTNPKVPNHVLFYTTLPGEEGSIEIEECVSGDGPMLDKNTLFTRKF